MDCRGMGPPVRRRQGARRYSEIGVSPCDEDRWTRRSQGIRPARGARHDSCRPCRIPRQAQRRGAPLALESVKVPHGLHTATRHLPSRAHRALPPAARRRGAPASPKPWRYGDSRTASGSPWQRWTGSSFPPGTTPRSSPSSRSPSPFSTGWRWTACRAARCTGSQRGADHRGLQLDHRAGGGPPAVQPDDQLGRDRHVRDAAPRRPAAGRGWIMAHVRRLPRAARLHSRGDRFRVLDGGHRNRAIAHLLRHFEVIGDDIDGALRLYCRQCVVTRRRAASWR